MESPIRTLYRYKHYFDEFFSAQSPAVQKKIDYVLYLLQHVERIPEKFLKHIEGSKGLYEIRVEVQGNLYRIFCCFDEGQLVVLYNGFQKKSQKTPKNEIELAEHLMALYFDEKNTK
ncbi:type II toxin-antitoxin system RelE/ParE family toxin [Spirosoma migulaei]